MHFFEFWFTNLSEGIPPEGEHIESICVKANRPPKSLEEASEWVQEDLKLAGYSRVCFVRESGLRRSREGFRSVRIRRKTCIGVNND